MPGTRQDTKAGMISNTVTALPRPHAARELADTPLPFLDWSLVETGMTNWVGERKEPIPASESEPQPFAVRVQHDRHWHGGANGAAEEPIEWETGGLPQQIPQRGFDRRFGEVMTVEHLELAHQQPHVARIFVQQEVAHRIADEAIDVFRTSFLA